jgi:tetratricopeptide (TPR) repeat protein
MGNYEVGGEQGRKALEAVTQVADPLVRADVEYALAYHHWFWLETEESRRHLERIMPAYRDAGMQWRLSETLGLAAIVATARGELDDAAARGDEAGSMGAAQGHPGGEVTGGRARFMVAIARGELDLADRVARRDRHLIDLAGFAWGYDTHVLTALLHMWRGEHDAGRAELLRGESIEVPGPFVGVLWGTRAILESLRGDRAAVLAIADQKWELIGPPDQPMLIGMRVATSMLAEALARVGAAERATELFEHVRDLRRRGVVRGYDTTIVDTVLGSVAGAAGEWDDAEAHFEAALQLAGEIDHVSGAADARRAYAAMLLARNRPGDATRAVALLEDALSRFRAIGAAGLASDVERLLRR